METLFGFGLLIAGVVWLWRKLTRPASRTRKTTVSPRPTIAISVSDTSPVHEEICDTGPVTATRDGGWILNPRSTFPLTLIETTRSIALEVKSLLDGGYFSGSYSVIRAITPIIARGNLRCKEIDAYIRSQKPIYLQAIERLKESSHDWLVASQRDRDDLLAGFRKRAIASLSIRPSCDLQTLFEYEPADAQLDDALIDRFGFENLRFYLRYADDLEKVRTVPPDHRDRERYEAMTQAGLARRGKEIPISAVLATMKLSELNSLETAPDHKAFGRKENAIEYLMRLPDLERKLDGIVAYRELFQLRSLPPEFAYIDLKAIAERWSYYSVISELMAHTFIMGGYAARNAASDTTYSSGIRGWDVSASDDSCPYCKSAAAKLYSRRQRPIVPLHLACRCSVSAKFDF